MTYNMYNTKYLSYASHSQQDHSCSRTFNYITQSNYSDSGKILPISRQFCLQNTKFSKVDGNKLVRLTVITLPASENNLSLEANVAGIAKYFFANCDKIGKRDF